MPDSAPFVPDSAPFMPDVPPLSRCIAPPDEAPPRSDDGALCCAVEPADLRRGSSGTLRIRKAGSGDQRRRRDRNQKAISH